MRNLAIKKAIIKFIQKLLIGSEYETIPVVGNYPEYFENLGIIIDCVDERIITNEDNGLLNYNFVTGSRTTLYISDFTISINIYSTIDEESNSIARFLVSQIRETNEIPQSDEINISQLFDDINIGIPVLKEMGQDQKLWRNSIILTIRTKNIKTKKGEFDKFLIEAKEKAEEYIEPPFPRIPRYWGIGNDPWLLNSDTFAGHKKIYYAGNASESGLYAWLVYPKSYGKCSIHVNGLSGGFQRTEESHNDIDYYIYRSINTVFKESGEYFKIESI